MKHLYISFMFLLGMLCVSCSDDNNNDPQLPNDEPETPVTPGENGDIDFSKVGLEYDAVSYTHLTLPTKRIV